MTPDVATSSALAQVFWAFSGGVATSFTPCIYPLIPITLAIFGATAESTRLRSFLLALCYVLGIATTYVVLGMISAKTGALFGSFLSKPPVVATLVILLCALALFSLDALKLSFLSKVQNSASKIGGKGFRGAYLMGTASGFVAAPCAGPTLVVILGIAAAQQDTIWGGVLLFSYAMGMGMLFLALGLFPEVLKKLPRSGNWLHAVKFLTAVLLIMVALFISQPYHVSYLRNVLLPQKALLGVVVVVCALGAWFSYRHATRAVRTLSAFVMSVALFYLVVVAPESTLKWLPNIEQTVASAAERSTIAMTDLFADWCAACKELEAKTFSAPEVQDVLSGIAIGRVDFTDENETTALISEKYAVAGLPCVLFFGGDGKEIPDSRLTGFVAPKAFLEHLRAVIARSKTS